MMIVTKRIIDALVASSRRWRRRCGQQQLFLLILDKFLRIYLLDLFAVSLRFQKICEHIMICIDDVTAKSTVRYFVARNADLTGAFSVPAKWDANAFMPLKGAFSWEFIRNNQYYLKWPRTPQPELGRTVPHAVRRSITVYISQQDEQFDRKLEDIRLWSALVGGISVFLTFRPERKQRPDDDSLDSSP